MGVDLSMWQSLYWRDRMHGGVHDRDIRLAHTQTSAVSEHANRFGHYPPCDKVKFIDRDPRSTPVG